MAEKLIRHWHTLRCIPRAPAKIDGARIERILKERGVTTTRRTIQRDLHELSAVFPLVCDEAHKPYGWSWAKGAEAFELPHMNIHTAITLQLVRAHLKRALPPATLQHLTHAFDNADKVVASMGAAGQKRWRKRLRVTSRFQPLTPPRTDDAVIAAVYDALLLARTLDVHYRGRGDDAPKAATLHPLGVVLRDGAIYLVCTFFDYADVRYLPLHRFVSASVTDDKRRVPKGFDLDAYLARGEFGFLLSERPVRLVARVDDVVARTLEETALSEDQTLRRSDDGAWTLSATVPDAKMLRGFILSYGARIEVLRPKRLRREIAMEAAAIVARYVD